MRTAHAVLIWTGAVLLTLTACSTDPVQVDPNVMTAPLSAAEHAAEIEQAMTVTPLPDGVNWRRIEIDQDGSYGVYGGAAMIEFQAACAWFAESLEAEDADDPERVAAAREMARQIPTWRAFSDAAFADQSLQDLMANVVDAVLASQRQPVIRFLTSNC
jgi:hypothetical protein